MSVIRHLATVLACLLSASAYADTPSACAAGSVASIQYTSCTIGDTVFSFGQTHVVNGQGQTLDTLKFNPIASKDGFLITGVWHNDNGYFADLWIDSFKIATVDGQATISGITVGNWSKSGYTEFGLADDANFANQAAVSVGSSKASASFALGPVSSASEIGVAVLSATNVGPGAVSYANAFFVNETANVMAVPEPSTSALMLAGIGVVCFGLRRRASASLTA